MKINAEVSGFQRSYTIGGPMGLADQALKDPDLVKVWVDGRYVPVVEAWPQLFQVAVGMVLCEECLLSGLPCWHEPETLTQKKISQQWGTVTQTFCPRGHHLESVMVLTERAAKAIEQQKGTALSLAKERDRARDGF